MSERTCIIEDCDRPTRSKTGDYCAPHMHRIERHGDPQAHVPIAPARRKLPPPVDHEDGTRTCRTCDARKPLEDYPRDSKGSLGRRRDCLPCHNDREAARYQADPEAARQRMREHRANNAPHVRQREAARYERNRAARIELAVEASHRRRARMKGAAQERGITVTYLRRRDGDACCYCGTGLDFNRYPKGQRPDNLATLEHRLPISRGGSHTDANCALACWRCNISKGSMTEDEWQVKQGNAPRRRIIGDHPGLIA